MIGYGVLEPDFFIVFKSGSFFARIISFGPVLPDGHGDSPLRRLSTDNWLNGLPHPNPLPTERAFTGFRVHNNTRSGNGRTVCQYNESVTGEILLVTKSTAGRPPETADHHLLATYARAGDETAFAALVAHHINLVHSAARRFRE